MIIEEIDHVKGHQDSTGKVLSTVKKLNLIADKLAMKAVNEVKCCKPEWHESLGAILKIDGKAITKKEGLMLISPPKKTNCMNGKEKNCN